MKTKSRKPKRSSHFNAGLCVLAGFAATAAAADTIDLGAEMTKRLRDAGKLDAIYKAARPGQSMPANMPATVIFEGAIRGKGLSVVAPPPISNPLVLQQNEIVNCGTTVVDETLEINSTTTNSTTFENTDQVSTENSFEVSLEVSYKIGDLGSKVTAKDGWKKTKLTMHKEGGSKSHALAWKNQPKITVPPQQMAVAQFVINEETLSRVPYTANYILEGDARVVFNAGAEGFRWVARAGNSLPAQALVFKAGGRNLYACRVVLGDKYAVGASEGPGSPCRYGSFGQQMLMFGYAGATNETYEWLVGNQGALDAAMAAPGSPRAFDAGKGVQLCYGNFKNNQAAPGTVQSDGSCAAVIPAGLPMGESVGTRDFRIVLDPTQGGVESRIKLDSYLTEAQRTIDIRGVFSGVQSVDGHVRVGNVPADCDWMKTAAASGKGATASSAPSGLKAVSASSPVRRTRKQPTALLPEATTKKIAVEPPPSE
jgi:hypothetical protein